MHEHPGLDLLHLARLSGMPRIDAEFFFNQDCIRLPGPPFIKCWKVKSVISFVSLTSICFRLYSLIIVSFLRVLLNCSYDSLIIGSDRLVENS